MPTTDWILHVDLDQFVAAVEIRRRPDLRGRPVVVGGSGDPTQPRMVVATASYEAREFGVRSGMPLRAAARRCPDAVFLPSDPQAYEEASAEVMDTLRSFPVVVEVWGWDEAFLGARTDDPHALAADVQHEVATRTGLSCSVGIGDNKLRAKTATGFAKPAGVFRLTKDNWMAVMGDRPLDALWGIGTKTARKLADHGLSTVAQLAAADADSLVERFGPTVGRWYPRLARGVGDTHVTAAPWVPRSRSREATYPLDLTSREQIEERVVDMARAVAHEVIADGRRVVRVAVKVRYSPFFTQTHIRTCPEPTTDVAEIARWALRVLDLFDLSRPVRLLGVRLELEPPEQIPP